MEVKEMLLSVLMAHDSILWMHPSLFDQSPTEGYLSCFYSLQHILLLQNSAVVKNLAVPSFLTFTSVLGQISPEVELENGFRCV